MAIASIAVAVVAATALMAAAAVLVPVAIAWEAGVLNAGSVVWGV